MWTKIKGFFSWLLEKLVGLGAWLPVALLGVAAIVVGAVVANIYTNNQSTMDTTRPLEQTQKQGSIGEALSPDINPLAVNSEVKVVENSFGGEITGVDTAKVTDDQKVKIAQAAESKKVETKYIAPESGLNPDRPIDYENSKYKIRITLPPRTEVIENGTGIKASNKNGALLFSVTTAEQTNLDQIKEQLTLSPEVSNLTGASFQGLPALKFSSNNQTGYVINKNGLSYYLIGQDNTLQNIKL